MRHYSIREYYFVEYEHLINNVYYLPRTGKCHKSVAVSVFSRDLTLEGKNGEI